MTKKGVIKKSTNVIVTNCTFTFDFKAGIVKIDGTMKGEDKTLRIAINNYTPDGWASEQFYRITKDKDSFIKLALFNNLEWNKSWYIYTADLVMVY